MDPITWKHRWAIALLAFVTFAPTLKVGFVWDDHMIIEQNPWIRHWDLASLKHDFISDNTQNTGDDYYRPLQAMVDRIDYTVWGLRPFGFHLSDILFHVLTGWVFLEFIMALGCSALTAFLTTCLFVVHPAAIEQFLSVAGRTTVLCFLWTLLSLLAFRKNGWRYTALGLLSYTAALFTKESGVAAPLLVILVFWYWRFDLKRYLVLIPMGVITAVYLLLRKNAVPFSIVYDPASVELFFTHVFPRILWHYVTLILWPWNLHSHRLIPHLTHAWLLYWIGWLGLVSYGVIARRRLLLFCVAWLTISLLPVTLTMIPGGFMIDHWAYPTSLAVLLPLGLLFTYGWDHHHETLGKILCVLFFVVLLFWALLVSLNVQLRGSDEKMFRWALKFTTSRPIKSNLGVILLKQGHYGEAVQYLDDVHEAYPEDSNNTNALAEAYWALGDRQRARQILEQMLTLNPADPLTLHNIQTIRQHGNARLSSGEKPLDYSARQQ